MTNTIYDWTRPKDFKSWYSQLPC